MRYLTLQSISIIQNLLHPPTTRMRIAHSGRIGSTWRLPGALRKTSENNIFKPNKPPKPRTSGAKSEWPSRCNAFAIARFLVCFCDLDLEPMTLIYKPDLRILNMYTKNQFNGDFLVWRFGDKTFVKTCISQINFLQQQTTVWLINWPACSWTSSGKFASRCQLSSDGVYRSTVGVSSFTAVQPATAYSCPLSSSR